MSAVLLQTADLSLFSDPSRRVAIPKLTGSRRVRRYDGVAVRFAGDELPTPFRGEGRGRTYDLTCRFTRKKQAQAQALLDLIDDAAGLPDSRLFLRTHYGQVAGLDDAAAVIVLQDDLAPQVGLYIDVTLVCEAVAFTLAV